MALSTRGRGTHGVPYSASDALLRPAAQAKASDQPSGVCTTSTTRGVPGARLIRIWKAERHEVLVAEGGYLWGGRSSGSLSSIPRAITGTDCATPTRPIWLRSRLPIAGGEPRSKTSTALCWERSL